ncbi:MAG TPA: response regulator [Ferrovibrio sp.]|uniref:response regulator n=1 Tax=Ferrovibrio sp. TaxID=1917215 RepID=UPI002ED21E75
MAEILVVEDDPMVLAMLRDSLESAGHAVREASSGSAALAMLQEKLSDLVVTDIYMPDGDGLELITRMRCFTQTPVIAMSGGNSFDTDLRMLPVASVLGACRILEKPFTHETLIAAVAQALQTPEV